MLVTKRIQNILCSLLQAKDSKEKSDFKKHLQLAEEMTSKSVSDFQLLCNLVKMNLSLNYPSNRQITRVAINIFSDCSVHSSMQKLTEVSEKKPSVL